MPIQLTIGVKTSDLEEGRRWVEVATGLSAEPRESSDRGGDYYAFYGQHGEHLRIVTNEDVYDGEPVTSAPSSWKIVLQIEEAESTSLFLEPLVSDTVHFKVLERVVY
jgi:hypothetical protein